MNPTPEINDSDFAKIVIGDSIRSAYTDPALLKGVTLEDILDQLRGEEGDLMVQSALAGYAASEYASAASGEPMILDKRLVGKRLNLNKGKLKEQLVNQLSEFLNLEADASQAFVQGLLAK